MEDITPQPTADNLEGEGTTPAVEPAVEPTTDGQDGIASEGSNHSSGRPETVPYDTFAEERRTNRELKTRLAQLERIATTPAVGDASANPAGDGVPSQFMLEDGSVDIQGYTKWMQSKIPDPASISQQVLKDIERRETLRDMKLKEENELIAKHPELKDDPEKRRIVEALKNQSLLEGQYKTLTEAADEVFNITKQVAQKTREQVQTDRTTQATMTTPAPTAKVDAGDVEMTKLQELMADPNPRVRDAARVEYLKRRLSK